MIKKYIQITLISYVLFMSFGFAKAQNENLFKKSKFKGYAYSPKVGRVEPDSIFKISNGQILMDGNHVGYLVSKKSFKNFKLSTQFRWVVKPGQKIKRNSGLMYHVSENQADKLWPSGIQYQIKLNSTGDFILLDSTSLSVNETIYGPGKSVGVKHFSDQEKEHGEWNKIEIVANGCNVKQYLNGVLVNEGKNASVCEGRILFQYEGSPIEFKDIEMIKIK